MKRNETERKGTVGKGNTILTPAQVLNDLRLRVLKAKGEFLAIGIETYVPFIEAEARREGLVLTADDKLELRQILNGRVFSTHLHWVELIERALKFQQAA